MRSSEEDVMLKKLAILCACSLFLASCAINPKLERLTAEQKNRLDSIEIITGKATRPSVFVGSVGGISCQKNMLQKGGISENEALEDLKLDAAFLDADAVTNLFCQGYSDTHSSNGCYASIQCTGEAVKYKP
jgi:uncharacterized protein YbjQ (UPF0145 family)